MELTVTAWMIILSLGGWLFPEAKQHSLRIDDPKGQTLLIHMIQEPEKSRVYIFDEASPELEQFAIVHKKGASSEWTVNLGNTVKELAVDPAVMVKDFATLAPKRLTAIEFKDGEKFQVQRTEKTATFKGADGTVLSLYADTAPASQFLASKGTTGYHVSVHGDLEHWLSLGIPLTLNKNEAATFKAGNAKDPVTKIFTFFAALMTSGDVCSSHLSEEVDPDVAAALKKYAPGIAKRMEKVTVYAGTPRARIGQLRSTQKDILTNIQTGFGDYDFAFFTEINNQRNDAFIILDEKKDGTWGVRAMLTGFEEKLVPEKINAKLKDK